MQNQTCLCCGRTEWNLLPDPKEDISITTSGVLVDRPLGKAQCSNCGMVQRVKEKFLADTDFYKKSYSGYYQRLGSRKFTPTRYHDLMNWIIKALEGENPKDILEIGSGNGEAMSAFSQRMQDINIEGVEPSVENSKLANQNGCKTFTGLFDDSFSSDKKYDLIYSNHVIQHTLDPNNFIKNMGVHLRDDGLGIIIVQDSRFTSNEIMYSDQNFSFLPENLKTIAENNGFYVKHHFTAPEIDSLLHSQMIVISKNKPETVGKVPTYNKELIYKKRVEYIEAWGKLEEFLLWKSSHRDQIVNFGAGIFSYCLVAYCDKYWDKVDYCVVEGEEGEFFGKTVKDLNKIELDEKNASLVLGIRPNLQEILRKKLSKKFNSLNIIEWGNFTNNI